MIREAFGLVYAGEEIPNLRELVDLRTVGAVPIGGKYRTIDFALSNMVNAGIRNVGVLTSRNYNSLMDHLGSGKAWDLSRKNDGLFVLTPFALRENQGVYRGKVEALKHSMEYIRRAKQEYAVFCDTTFIYNADIDAMMKYHIESNADITMLYRQVPDDMINDDPAQSEIFLNIDENGKIKGLEINPSLSTLNKRSLKTYILRKDILEHLVDDSYAKGEYKFSEGLLRSNLHRTKVMGFEHKGYVGTMNSVASYFKFNMDLLNEKIRNELFLPSHPIYTRPQDSVPTKYIGDASVHNCLVANGSVIEGKVENSIIFRNVRIGKNATVKNSIILANTMISENAEMDHVILDKDVHVRPGTRLVGNASFPVVIRKGATV